MKERDNWGKYGRPKAIDSKVFKRQYSRVIVGELKPFECMKQLGLTNPTFYRYKKQYEQEKSK